MDFSQNKKARHATSAHKVEVGQRLFDRFGSILVLPAVLIIVIGWIGAIGWALIWLLGWYNT